MLMVAKKSQTDKNIIFKRGADQYTEGDGRLFQKHR